MGLRGQLKLLLNNRVGIMVSPIPRWKKKNKINEDATGADGIKQHGLIFQGRCRSSYLLASRSLFFFSFYLMELRRVPFPYISIQMTNDAHSSVARVRKD